jgi:hypothetical protein
MNRFFTSMGGLDPPNQKPRNENLKVWFGASSAPMEKRVFGSLKRDQSLDQLSKNPNERRHPGAGRGNAFLCAIHDERKAYSRPSPG